MFTKSLSATGVLNSTSKGSKKVMLATSAATFALMATTIPMSAQIIQMMTRLLRLKVEQL